MKKNNGANRNIASYLQYEALKMMNQCAEIQLRDIEI